MTKPTFNSQISLGNVLTLVGLLGAGLLAFAQVQGLASRNAAAVSALEIQADEHESRLRVAETEIARGDERLSSILTLLSRIDARLERIEIEGGR